jgi:hypothetical protein
VNLTTQLRQLLSPLDYIEEDQTTLGQITRFGLLWHNWLRTHGCHAKGRQNFKPDPFWTSHEIMVKRGPKLVNLRVSVQINYPKYNITF